MPDKQADVNDREVRDGQSGFSDTDSFFSLNGSPLLIGEERVGSKLSKRNPGTNSPETSQILGRNASHKNKAPGGLRWRLVSKMRSKGADNDSVESPEPETAQVDPQLATPGPSAASKTMSPPPMSSKQSAGSGKAGFSVAHASPDQKHLLRHLVTRSKRENSRKDDQPADNSAGSEAQGTESSQEDRGEDEILDEELEADDFTLRLFESTRQVDVRPKASGPSDVSSEENQGLVGIFADPAAAPDDWANDFELGDDIVSQNDSADAVFGEELVFRADSTRGQHSMKLEGEPLFDIQTLMEADLHDKSSKMAPSLASRQITDIIVPLSQRLYGLIDSELPTLMNLLQEAQYYNSLRFLDSFSSHCSDAIDADDSADLIDWKIEYAKLRGDLLLECKERLRFARSLRDSGRRAGAMDALDKAADSLSRREAGQSDDDTNSDTNLIAVELCYERGLLSLLQGEREIEALEYLRLGERIARAVAQFDKRFAWWISISKFRVGQTLYSSRQPVEAIQCLCEFGIEALESTLSMLKEIGYGRTPSADIFRVLPLCPRLLSEALLLVGNTLVSLGLHDVARPVGSSARSLISGLPYPALGMASDVLERRLKRPSQIFSTNMTLSIDGLDSDDEDWDLEIAQELNITIERSSPALLPSFARERPGAQRGRTLAEEEVSHAVQRLISQSEAIRKQKRFPKPTDPLGPGKSFGPEEHERWLRDYVLLPLIEKHAVTSGDDLGNTPLDRNIETLLVPFQSENDPVEDYRARLPYLEAFRQNWLLLHLETAWKLQRRSETNSRCIQQMRHLLQTFFSDMTSFFQNVPVLDNQDCEERMKALMYAFEMLELARCLLLNNKVEAQAFDKFGDEARLCILEVTKHPSQILRRTFLVLRLDLFLHFVRCHHETTAELPDEPAYIIGQIDLIRRRIEREVSNFTDVSRFDEGTLTDEQQECFLLLIESMAGYCLAFIGHSPIDCSRIQTPDHRADEMQVFAHVSGALDNLFEQIPVSHLCRCKAAFFLAYRLRNEFHDHNLAERYIFDALRSLKTCQSLLHPIFPVTLESSTLAQNILSFYGDVLSRTGKHRYSLIALHSTMDAQQCRESDRQGIYVLATRIATAAMTRNDWRSAIRLLMAYKLAVHPKDGRRNDFVRFCFTISSLCSNSGCFKAALVPLQACDALLREEELRSFLKQEENQVSNVSLASWVAGKNLWGLMRRLEKFLENDARGQKAMISESDHFQVDLCKARLFIDSGQFDKAESALRSLLFRDLPPLAAYRVFFLISKSKLRRGEITKCLEHVREMDRILASSKPGNAKPTPSLHESLRGVTSPLHSTAAPQVIFLRIRALIVGQRFPEALQFAEEAFESCRADGLMRDLAKLSYLRGRIISQLLLTDTPFSQGSFSGTSLSAFLEDSETPERPYSNVHTRGKVTAVALDAFSHASRLFRAISDELHAAKSDSYWAKTALDWIFRVVAFKFQVKKLNGQQYQLSPHCLVSMTELEELVGSLLRFAQVANIPIFLMENLISNAELRFCQGSESSIWRPWVVDAWVLFSKLFTDGQHFTVLSVKAGSISHVLKLVALLGRMVRLLLFDAEGGMDLSYRHVRVFEAYITLSRDLEKRLNLNSEETPGGESKEPEDEVVSDSASEEDRLSVGHSSSKETTTGNVLRFISTEGVELGKLSYQAFLRKPQQHLVAAFREGSYALSQVPLFDLQRLLKGSQEETEIGLESMKVLGDKTNHLGNLLSSLGKESPEEDQFEPGLSPIERVLSSIHRIKAESCRYTSGEISLEEMGARNAVTFRLWMTANPLAHRQWILPESIIRHTLWILNPPGALGYYAAEQGRCVRRVSFDVGDHLEINSDINCFSGLYEQEGGDLRYKQELKYIESLIVETGPPDAKEGPGFWRKNRGFPRNLSNEVFHAPRKFLDTNYNPNPNEPEARPVLLLCDPKIQGVPWEVLLEHTVVRSSTLLDAIRGSQPKARRARSRRPIEMATTKSVVRYIAFYPDDPEELNGIGTSRRQHLSFKVLANLRPYSTDRLAKELAMGGFSNRGHLNSVARPTGPLTSPLSRTDGLGLFREREIALKHRHVSFVRVTGLGSATEFDLEDAMSHLESHVQVFLCSYADLVETDNSIFRLLDRSSSGVLLFAPGWAIHVVARFLEDWELARELELSFLREKNLVSVVKILVRELSKFVREKVIPVAVYLGDDINRIFPRRIEKSLARVEQRPKVSYRDNLNVRASAKVTRRLVNLSLSR